MTVTLSVAVTFCPALPAAIKNFYPILTNSWYTSTICFVIFSQS